MPQHSRLAHTLGALVLLVGARAWAAEPLGDVYADTWVATDALGRTLPTYAEVGPPRANRQVGLFYFLWVNQGVSNRSNQPVRDLTEIIAKNPDHPEFGPKGTFHFWGQPELGYYTIDDPYVLTRHRSMLTAAGVDALVFDQTNALIYEQEMLAVCANLDEGRKQGLPVPKIAAMHNSSPEKSVPRLYAALYQKDLYRELWFRWLDKPLLLSPTEALSDEVKDFFTIRHTWAFTSGKWFGTGRDKWTWIDWSPQQPGWHEDKSRPEEISVCISPHPIDGRGRSTANGKTGARLLPNQLQTDKGIYANEQWQRALAVDPPFIFVTGWNEWIVQRQIWGDPHKPLYCGFKKLGEGDSYFVDQFSQEFSRDAEPMLGGHGDNYYYQLVANIRRYKGVRPPVPPVSKPITIDGKFADWSGVLPEFRDFQGDTLHRDHVGWNKSLVYKDDTGRNDLIRAHVAASPTQVFLHAACAAEITPRTDPHWMQVFIDLDQNAQTGAHGYELMVNRTPPTTAGLAIHRFSNGAWTEVGRAAFAVTGDQLELAMPRKLFGPAAQLSFDFKWADNLQKDDDVAEFALHGDSAPDRRFNYRYDQKVTPALIQSWTDAVKQPARAP